MEIKDYKNDDNVLNIYPLGSRVYGSCTPESDYDYILVVKNYFDSNDINVHIYTEEQFRLSLNNHDIQALECIHLPNHLIIKETIKFSYILDKKKLRSAISTIASNSWVKGKKKLIVSGDYDLHLAIKSIFHSLRIIDFGIQIATHNKIISYHSMNYVLVDLKKLSESYQRVDLWETIDTKYRKLFNNSSSIFKSLCPKDTTKELKMKELEIILKNNSYYVLKSNKQLLEDIFNLFDK